MPEPKKPRKSKKSAKKRQDATKTPTRALMVRGRPTKRRQISLSWLRKRFLRVYEETFGNVSETCYRVGIHRATFYRWMKSTSRVNRKFQAALAALDPDEKLLDAAEFVVGFHLSENNLRAAELVLKSAKAKKRGYHETVEIAQTDTEELKKLRAIIENRAVQEGKTYPEMLAIFKENYASWYKPELVEKLVSEANN